MEDQRQWWTVCVSYHDEQGFDDLILEAVRPFFDEHPCDGAYYLRHWRRGPHLRLNVSTTAEHLRQAVLPDVQRHAGRFLRTHPSKSTLDLGALAPEYLRLARVEQDEGPLWPIRPDNSVVVEPYDSRAPVLGGAEAARFVAAFHVASTSAAFAATARVRSDGRPLSLALELMAATAHEYSGGGLRIGYVSFRAHAEIYLARHPAGTDLRAAWDRLYRRSGGELRELLRRVASAPVACDIGAQWTAALGSVLDEGFALVDAGLMLVNREQADPEPPGEPTTFLRELLANRDFRDRMKPSRPFRRYRLVLNLLYLHLTKLGIRPAQRALLGHLLANAAEDVYGVDAATLVTEASAALP